MGYRDGCRFRDWYEKTYGKEADLTDPQVAELQRAYVAGFDNGFRESQTYDPMWDAD